MTVALNLDVAREATVTSGTAYQVTEPLGDIPPAIGGFQLRWEGEEATRSQPHTRWTMSPGPE